MTDYIDAGGCRIAYEVSGPAGAPPLLLTSSLGSTRELLWSRQVPAFTREFRVIRYDPRGHGESSVPSGEYTLDQLGRDAVAVLDAVGAASAHVCGISMGGITAMWLGVHAANRVKSLVVANTAARIGSLQSWSDRLALVRAEGLAGVAAQAMPRWFTQPFREREPGTIRAFQSMVESISPAGYLGCCAALCDGDLREAISAIRCPTLAIAGAADALTPPEALAFVQAQVTGSQLVTLACSHISNVEQSDAFNDAVSAFLGAGPKDRTRPTA
jgi:3-oxoadipate enol-lactonase